ncbi:hypothetical protein HJG53_11110 [Sphingomonas sp. ID1715]|uniref:hypothetical protein n=1 Tax=Sphingomonas sp. ID1715 TaxID=1656898 RepID=UPI0014885516|nr:hypothetical protein [Sphingomonas sp. ID1715]NNM77455.1 hypothetical protein [Sphingomonas sp. ID1715]
MADAHRLYRLYTVKHGEIVRHRDFEARDDREALRRASALRRDGARELWDLSSAPARHVSTI